MSWFQELPDDSWNLVQAGRDATRLDAPCKGLRLLGFDILGLRRAQRSASRVLGCGLLG